jgi:hypothetical protein
MPATAGEGRVKYRETILDGLEHAPEAFIGLFPSQHQRRNLNANPTVVPIRSQFLPGQKEKGLTPFDVSPFVAVPKTGLEPARGDKPH